MINDADRHLLASLRRAQAGEPRGFDEIVRCLERPLLGFLRSRGADDAEGTANEVLIRAFERVGDFDGNAAQFRAWIFRIARNRLVDEARKRQRRPEGLSMAPEMLPERHDETGLEDRIGERERIERLLADLTAEQREVVLLRVVAGLSVDETARVVDRAPGAVRALQHRALARLRQRVLSTTP